jgi:hypothetical protein
MQSYYDINVSKNGIHLFATHPRSLVNEDDAKELAVLLRSKFPVSEGYDVSVTYWQATGKHLNF